MDQFGFYKKNQYATTRNSRVYINPNFNRNGPDDVPTQFNSNVMYLNPNFSRKTSSQMHIVHQCNNAKDQAIKPKIHVNPNFITPKPQLPILSNCESVVINSVSSTSTPTNTDNQSAFVKESQADNKYQINRLTSTGYPPAYVQVRQAGNEYPINTQTRTVTNSRYCLVRQKEIKALKPPVTKILPNNNKLHTVKINKYKLVSINAVKKNLASDKSSTIKGSETPTSSMYRTRLKPILNIQNTRFKYIKRNSMSTLNLSDTKQSKVRRVSITINKNILKTSYRQPKKIVKGAMKKNNIPCPLFKKYGKCLRRARGNCDYLHDKKHVSICRKFLKGICHDQQCLLSHDLTDKKMPTCYFYLQGNCTKNDCPYLHVKLNEKAKICPDFVKGYCEKGDKCLYRHINVSPQIVSKLTRTKKQNSYTHINIKNISEKAKDNRTNIVNMRAPIKVTIDKRDESTEHRYFREVTDDATSSEQCDLIKPTRCKLGTLPSFIQL